MLKATTCVSNLQGIDRDESIRLLQSLQEERKRNEFLEKALEKALEGDKWQEPEQPISQTK